jgi:TldD protein
VAHEAIGHFSEAAAIATIDLRHRLGCRLAADDFDAFDDPTLAAAARYEVDDEGSAAIGPTQIVAGGVLTQQLHSRRSAEMAETLPTANARTAQITLPPIPRLSNLVIPPGTRSQEELVYSMGYGLLVHHLSHGYSRGLDIEARIVLAERVEAGRPTGRFVSGGRISERIDVLTRCLGRGDRNELNPNALCGKHGQILYDVGTVAPAMLLSNLRIAA